MNRLEIIENAVCMLDDCDDAIKAYGLCKYHATDYEIELSRSRKYFDILIDNETARFCARMNYIHSTYKQMVVS